VPIEIAPNNIELDRLDGGFSPDTPEPGVAANASPDMLNLLLEAGSHAPETRKGYERLSAGRSSLTGHYVKNLYFYETIDANNRRRFLIAIMSNGAEAADNVQVWAYDLEANTFERVDTAGRQWENPKSPHWSVVVSGVYYGGVRGDVIYSYHPTEGWNDDPTALVDPKSWVDAINDDVDTASEFARDYAFKGPKQKVELDGEFYSPLHGIRFDKWDDSAEYRKGDLVSRKHVWDTTESYWKSFEARRDHDAATGNAPGTGDGWRAYWKKIRLPNILDEDDNITRAWTDANIGVKSSVGVFYGDRMMVRRDNEDERNMVQYSAPLDLEKDGRIRDVEFDPTDWAAVDDLKSGEGGGWVPFAPGRGDAIRGMLDMGNYLVVSKRWRTDVLNGRSEQTWSIRKLGDQGVVALNCMTECDGLVYGLSHNGTLWVTDGTSLREVPGYEKTREFIKERIDRLLAATASDEDDEHWMPSIFEYDHKVWLALPDTYAAGTPDDITLVYDPVPEGGSWWKLNLPILSATTGARNRARRLWIATPKRSGNATVFEYQDDPGDLGFTDDDPLGGATPLTTAIAWHYRSSWFQWGLRHNERRVRRAWALLKSAVGVTIKGYRDFDTTAVYTVNRSAGDDASDFYEGKALGRAASATAIQVSGTAATGGPAIIGIGVDTEPIRTRFHRNSN